MASMMAPVCQMYAVSPWMTPLSMMSALSVGRYSDRIVWIVWNTTTAISRPR